MTKIRKGPEAISKAIRFKEPSSSIQAMAAPGPVLNRRGRFADIRCCYCRELGYYQSHCPVRGRGISGVFREGEKGQVCPISK